VSDALLTVAWGAVLAAGLGGVALLRRLGVPSTYTRDLVHVGAGSWVLGWRLWGSWVAPVTIPVVAAAAVIALPRVRGRAADRVRDALVGGDEKWRGVALYTVSSAIFTGLAFADAAFPAGSALLALALGDGLGGAVGRRFGRHFFAAPGSKRKSVEGSLTVALMTFVAVLVAGSCFGTPASLLLVATSAGVLASAAEALAPRGTDNLVVPAAVWALARFCS
jgi:dolichol kinase